MQFWSPVARRKLRGFRGEVVNFLQSRRHSPSDEGRKMRPLAFITRRVMATIIVNRLPLDYRPAAD